MAKTEITASLEPRCRKLAEQLGFELVDVCLDREPTGKYLRIYIDRPEGISLDDCEAYHKAVRPLAEQRTRPGNTFQRITASQSRSVK